MNTYRTFVARAVAAAGIALSLITLSAPLLSHADIGSSPVTAENAATRQNHMRERMSSRLDQMAKRLQINASQQDVWTAYTKTVESRIGTKLTRPADDADAATVARFRAELAKEHAQKLAQLADATAQLQQTLNPEQRKALDEMVRDRGRRDGHKDHRGERRHDQ